jgi:hypothetical protein
MKRIANVDKMSKKARKAYYNTIRGYPLIPPTRKNKGTYEYKKAKEKLI